MTISISRTALLLGCSLLVAACGRKGPLIYPDMLVPAAPSAVAAQQVGAGVKLQFTLPDKNRSGKSLHGLAEVRINKRSLESGQKDVCRSCTSDYALFKTIYLAHLPTDIQRFGNSLVLLDSDVAAGSSYSYRLVPFTDDGIEGAAATTADVRMTPPLLAPEIQIESLPTEIRLKISQKLPVSGQLLGFNLYRYTGGIKSFQPINKVLFNGVEYIDASIERDTKYRYTVRSVIKNVAGDLIESSESAEVEGVLKNDE